MSVWADANHPAWIQTVGDNIYPAGIHSWNDHQVDSKWRDIYKQPSLKDLVWHMALGNHDYGVLRSEEWNQVQCLIINPLMGTLKPQSNGPLYTNTVIDTLAVDGWTVTFGTARMGLGGLRPRPVPYSLYQM